MDHTFGAPSNGDRGYYEDLGIKIILNSGLFDGGDKFDPQLILYSFTAGRVGIIFLQII